MKGPADLAKGWFAKAESDLAGARALLAGPGPYDTACFHCQQAAEKYIKGFLAWRGHPFPFTHDLDELARLCDLAEPGLNLHQPDVASLTDYAVKLRYDNEFWPSQEDTAEALAVAQRIRATILALLDPSLRPGSAESEPGVM